LTDIQLGDRLSGPFEYALVLTYSLQLDWFERWFLPRLGSQTNKRIVLADQHRLVEEMDQAAKWGRVRAAQRGYLVTGVESSASFHPKVVLLAGKEQARMLIGSGNLTMTGMTRAGEIFAEFNYPADGQAPFVTLGEVLRHLIANDRLDAFSVEQVSGILDHFPYLKGSAGESARLRHNLQIPFAVQLTQAVAGRKVRELWVLAPFHDPHLIALTELVTSLKPDRTYLLVQPGATSIDPQELERAKSALGLDVRTARREDYYLHAKFYLARLSETTLSLGGSPNCSTGALLKVPPAGNYELATLVEEPWSELEHLLEGLQIETAGLIADLKVSLSPPWTSVPSWGVARALVDDGRLNVETYGTLPPLASVTVGDRELELPRIWPPLIIDLPPETLSSLSQHQLSVALLSESGDRSNAVFPVLVDALARAWGAADYSGLSNLANVTLNDEDWMQYFLRLEADILLEIPPSLRVRAASGTRGGQDSPDEDDSEPLISEWQGFDVGKLKQDERYRQSLDPSGASTLAARGHTPLSVLGRVARKLSAGIAPQPPDDDESGPTTGNEQPDPDEAENLEEERQRTAIRMWRRARWISRRRLGFLATLMGRPEIDPEVVARTHSVIQTTLILLGARPFADSNGVLELELDNWELYWGLAPDSGWFNKLVPEMAYRAEAGYTREPDGEPQLLAALLRGATLNLPIDLEIRLRAMIRRIALHSPVPMRADLVHAGGMVLASLAGDSTVDVADAVGRLRDLAVSVSLEMVRLEIAQVTSESLENLTYRSSAIEDVYAPILTLKFDPHSTSTEQVVARLERLLVAWMRIEPLKCYRIFGEPEFGNGTAELALVYEVELVLPRLEVDSIEPIRSVTNRHTKEERMLQALTVPSPVADRLTFALPDAGEGFSHDEEDQGQGPSLSRGDSVAEIITLK